MNPHLQIEKKRRRTFDDLFQIGLPQLSDEKIQEINSYIGGEMKKPIYILYASILSNIDREKRIFDEQEIITPLRFYAIPQQGDIVQLENKDYLVLRVRYEAVKKAVAQPIFYKAQYLYLKEIENKEEFGKLIFD